MAWQVIYHPDVQQDLTRLGSAAANRVLDVIEERIRDGEPDKRGKPLRGALAGCRRIRTGKTRIVYKVNKEAIQVLIIAVGEPPRMFRRLVGVSHATSADSSSCR